VQITRFAGPEVLDVVDLPDPVPGDGEQLFAIRSSDVDFADTHHSRSPDPCPSRTR
jgi:NADPH:quinone reductase-like Zn-dependent oxidoreductase